MCASGPRRRSPPLPGSVLIPLGELPDRLDELDPRRVDRRLLPPRRALGARARRAREGRVHAGAPPHRRHRRVVGQGRPRAAAVLTCARAHAGRRRTSHASMRCSRRCASRGIETVPLARRLGRVTAAEVVSPIDLPPFRNSQMDGFAVRAADVAAAPVDAARRARDRRGAPATPAPLPPGTAIRIMTGAPVPAGADAVVPVEDTTRRRRRRHDRARARRRRVRARGRIGPRRRRGSAARRAAARLAAPRRARRRRPRRRRRAHAACGSR